jgi:hypothetical protein
MLKRCTSCGYSNESILTHLIDANEEKCLCPNCVAVAVANGTMKLEANEALCDDVTGEIGAVVFINGNERYALTPRRMIRLLAHDLRAYEWQALANKYGANQFMLHDDFYTEEGNPWQPTVNVPVYEWWDVVEINGKHYCEVFEISGEMDSDDVFQIDAFLQSVAWKYGVDIDDVKTYTMDKIEFNANGMKFGAECCGCWIDGVPEWLRTEEA